MAPFRASSGASSISSHECRHKRREESSAAAVRRLPFFAILVGVD
jgi:hypothetical protein